MRTEPESNMRQWNMADKGHLWEATRENPSHHASCNKQTFLINFYLIQKCAWKEKL